MMGQNLLAIFRSSWVMWVLGLASITAVALFIERLIYFTRNSFNPNRGMRELRQLLATSGPAQALSWSRGQKNPLGRLFTNALENSGLTAEELSDMLYSQILEERVRYERLLGGMGTLANAATLLGLLGTVTGLIGAFANIAATGSGGPAVVAKGIAEALYTTAFGLIIGIPTLFVYNYFSKKAADQAAKLESVADRLVVLIGRTRAQFETLSSPSAATPPEPQPQSNPTNESTWKF